jgi:prepilin-type N-terminal cleavage/methylation domain-containing protein
MNKGFSLIELSIVLVILGLLTGGILAGQSLIRAAELRSVTADMDRYKTAVSAFRGKYFALPGDMPNATKFWGVANATPATCRTTASTDETTCDGDGNGIIQDITGSSEIYRAWQHLANAGLVEGSYQGNPGSGSVYDYDIGRNAPRSKISNAGFGLQLYDQSTAPATSSWPTIYMGNALWFGADNSNLNLGGSVLKPEEAWNIDTKVDDGMPAQGALIAGTVGTCTDSTDASLRTAGYNLTSPTASCFLVSKLQ